MSSKIEEQKQWSLHSVETMLTVLTGRLLHKGTILRQTTVVLLQKKKKDFRCLEVLEGLLNCSKKTRRVRFFLRPWIRPNIGE